MYAGSIDFRRKRTRADRTLDHLKGLDSRLFTAVTKHRPSPADSVLPKLSTLANHSILWVGLAAVMATFGGRRGKRAAGRGLGSIALTSLTVSQVVKRVARRPRPSLRNVPAVRQLKVAPLTTSFPSGHSASAAAFLTAVAMEWKVAGLLIAPLAGSVAYSRVYVGVHYPGDVLVGALLGSGVASATRLQFPTVPSRRKAGAPSDRQKILEVDPEGGGLHVLANPDSGSAVGFSHAGPIEIGLPAASLFESGGDEGLVDALERVADGASALAASGGDGTIGAAAELAADRGLPLMVLPSGTLNHLARDIRIDSVADSIDAYKAGETIEIDIGEIDGLSFINTATIGAYPEMIELREKLQGRIGRWPAHVISVLWTVTRAEPLKLRINGRERTVWMVFVGNGSHEPAGFAPGWRPELDDGKLDLRILHGETPLARLRLIISILAGRLTSSAAYERDLVEEIKVESDREALSITRDGDHLEASGSFTISKRPGCLTVFAPHD